MGKLFIMSSNLAFHNPCYGERRGSGETRVRERNLNFKNKNKNNTFLTLLDFEDIENVAPYVTFGSIFADALMTVGGGISMQYHISHISHPKGGRQNLFSMCGYKLQRSLICVDWLQFRATTMSCLFC